jgi:NADPH:quinone reductase-like Zn-dependent oxidoreductase
MKAVQFSEYGGPDVLHVAEIEEPHAGPGQIRVAVRAAGINPIDFKVRSGMFAQTPAPDAATTTARDASGVVDEVGEGVTGVAVGDEVFGEAVGGAAAEYAVLGHWAGKPAGMSFEEAAVLAVAVETAQRALRIIGVAPGATVLVNGAAGGVGTAAVQFALADGAGVVIGTASENNHDYLRSLGVTPTTYGDGLVQRVRELAPQGVDLALDTAGRGVLPALIEITGDPAKVVTIASYDAADFGVRLTAGGGETRSWDALEQAAALFEQGKFSLPVERAFPFDQAPDAHRLSEAGHVRGKLVLIPA